MNYLKPFKKRSLFITFIILVLIGFGIWWYFTDIAIMFGNYGKTHTYIDISLSVVMILGFPLFLIGILYKGMLFGHRENLHHKTGIGTLSGIIGTIISGSSCCGLTLASYFGLLPLMSMLPYSGLEIKILGTAGLLWAIQDTYKNLEVCRVGKKK
ncbi:MAG: hypothetical protein PHY14_02440 [Candidatus Gracilibacteria bacterium]|nr:hypothetical protein [Candidatus Gracilibacteria bacterium]